MSRRLTILESQAIPIRGLALAWLAVLPFAVCAPIAWWGGPELAGIAAEGARFWGGALLLFFSGVRRGLSFRTEGGPTARQFVAFAGLFGAGIATLLSPLPFALSIIAVMFVAMTLEDRRAAVRGEVPIFFAHLRPAQMLVAAGLVAAIGLVA